MKRIFVTGCSFTQFSWPTWGDYLVHHFNVTGRFGVNFGRCGVGNQYMFTNLMEYSVKHKFNKDDLVIVEWSSYCREDRYVSGGWVSPGNIFNQGIYSNEFVKTWADPEHYIYRDMAIIKSTRLSMKQLGVQYYDLSMMPILHLDNNGDKFSDLLINEQVDLYGLKTDFVSIMEFCGLLDHSLNTANKRPKSYYLNQKPTDASAEWHPMPEEHWRYVNEVVAPKLNIEFTQETIDFYHYWNEKIANMKQPIALTETGWPH